MDTRIKSIEISFILIRSLGSYEKNTVYWIAKNKEFRNLRQKRTIMVIVFYGIPPPHIFNMERNEGLTKIERGNFLGLRIGGKCGLEIVKIL